ncbi:MAG TPA: protein kinase, partial [Acidimicrobiales bacterium]
MERLGDHDLIALVGEGATAEVWRARKRSGLGQVVAIKRVRVATGPDQRSRLRAEAAVLHDLDHPHIVRILDILDDGEGVAIVMAYAPGGTLAGL